VKATLQGDAKVVAVLQAPFSIRRASRGIAFVRGQGRRLKEGLAYARELTSARTPIYLGWGISEVSGDEKVEQAILTRLDSKWQPIPGREQVISVDTIVVGYGLLPNNHLGRMLGCKHYFDKHSGAWLPLRDGTFQTSLPGVYIVGDAAEINGAEAARLEGRLAGLAVAHHEGYLSEAAAGYQMVALKHQIKRQHRFAQFLQDVFSPDIKNANSFLKLLGDQTIACRCEEVTLGEICQALAAVASSPAEIKMMTRSGMGNCLGRICETTINCTLVAAGFGRENITPEWKGFSIRPPLEPIPVSVLTQSD
jgi:NAD(P)H-nitrite reductase large subunit